MRVKNLKNNKILSERARANTQVTHLDRPTTNNLTAYFNNSHYLDNIKEDTRQVGIEPNTQIPHHQLALFTEPDPKTKLKRHSLGLAILLLVFSAGTYGVLSNIPSLQAANSALASPYSQPADKTLLKRKLIASRSESPRGSHLQSMAMNIMKEEDWDIQKVHYFKRSWDKLELERQSETKNVIWFQLFESSLIRELKSYIDQADTYDYNTSVRERALLALAKSLSIQPPQPLSIETESEESAAQTVSTDIIEVKTEQKINSAQKAVSDVSDLPVPTVKTVQVASLGEISSLDLEATQSLPDPSLSHKPTEKELDTIIAQFVNSYELGDIKQFASLFTNDVISNSHKDIDGLKSQYSDLFNSTTERQMILHDMKWKFNKDKAIGKGKMELSLVSTEDSQEKEQFGRLQLVAEKQQDKIVFTRFYLLTE